MLFRRSSSKRMRSRGGRSIAGYSLIESNVAAALAGGFLAAILVLNSNMLGLLRSAKETASASQALQERVEQMRIANWVQITDSTYIKNQLLQAPTKSGSVLPGLVEKITVSAYPATSSSTLASVTQTATGLVTVNSAGTGLADARMVRVDISLTWGGSSKQRERTRATAALIAKGGISK